MASLFMLAFMATIVILAQPTQQQKLQGLRIGPITISRTPTNQTRSASSTSSVRRSARRGHRTQPLIVSKAVAVIKGSEVNGTIWFDQTGSGPVSVTGEIGGLKAGEHGFHVHQFGDLTDGCISTGPHYNPHNQSHAAPTDRMRHVGDLGNILANDEGLAAVNITDRQLSLVGSNSIIGRAVVVHADVDDLGKGGHELSKTTGNAGGRLACGIIGLAKA